MKHKKEITFLLSVDTEEEWDWEGPFPEDSFEVTNLQELPAFQEFCEDIGIRPCYFVDYPAAKLLHGQVPFLERVAANKCEIGAHLHPWANPPFFDKPNDENSHVINLPLTQVEAKLDALLEVFNQELDCFPKSFRTGRWGISEAVIKLLYLRGFDVDSSVYPFYHNSYFTCEGSPLRPYWPDFDKVLAAGNQRNILEIPVTVGFNRSWFEAAESIHRICHTPLLETLKTTALLWHTNILRKIYFSPEVSTSEDMITLAEASIKHGNDFLHMYFHSSNLIDHSTGFFSVDNAHQLIQKRITDVIRHLQKHYHVNFMTPSEYKIYLQSNNEQLAS